MAQALLGRADVAWATHGLADTNKLFGYAREKLIKVSVDDWLMLLMRIMIMCAVTRACTERHDLARSPAHSRPRC